MLSSSSYVNISSTFVKHCILQNPWTRLVEPTQTLLRPFTGLRAVEECLATLVSEANSEWICLSSRSRQMSGTMKGETWWWRFEMKGCGNRCLVWDAERQERSAVKYEDSNHTESRQRKAWGFFLPEKHILDIKNFQSSIRRDAEIWSLFLSKQVTFQSSNEAIGTYLDMQTQAQLFCQCWHKGKLNTKQLQRKRNKVS